MPALLVGRKAAVGRAVPGAKGLLELRAENLVAFAEASVLPALRELSPELIHDAYYQQVRRSEGDDVVIDPAAPLLETRGVLGEPECRAMAEAFLAQLVRIDDLHWREARLLPTATPFYRPDVRGVAYYEFPVRPSGYVMTATGEHDEPIVRWSHISEPLSERLLLEAGDRAGSIRNFYRVDEGSFVAEGDGEQIVAQLGELPFVDGGFDAGRQNPGSSAELVAPSSWRELKSLYHISFGQHASQLRDAATDSWAAMAKLQQTTVASTIVVFPWFKEAGTVADQRQYDQFTTGGCAWFDCNSGCGPTAWAMLLGWIDGRTRYPYYDPRWSSCDRLFGGAAPASNTCEVERVVAAIRWSVSTFCPGATSPVKMGDVQEYLDGNYWYFDGKYWRYYAGPYRASEYDQKNLFQVNENMIRDHAIAAIQENKPCIIGTGGAVWNAHYPLAFGYLSIKFVDLSDGIEDDRVDYFEINEGWGSAHPKNIDFVPAKTWFAGSILPGKRLQTQLERCRDPGVARPDSQANTIWFLGSNNVWREVKHDGKPVGTGLAGDPLLPVSGGRVRWFHNGTYEWSYFDSRATRIEVSFPDTFPTGLIIIQALQ